MKKYILTYIILLLAGVNPVWGQTTVPTDLSTWEISKISLTIADKTYTGNVHNYTTSDYTFLSYNGVELTPSDFSFSLIDISEYAKTNAGDYNQGVQIVHNNESYTNRTETFYVSRKILPKSITASDITITSSATNSSIEYNGSAQSPSFTVHDNTRGVDLVLNTDYELDNTGDYTASATTVGNYKTKIKGKGNYEGTRSEKYDWAITSKAIAADDITVSSPTYKGTAFTDEEIKALVSVAVGSTPLIKGTDYTVTVASGTYLNATTYTAAITITGTGNYSGTPTVNFKISQKDITTTGITITPSAGNNSIAYNGSPQSPTFTITYGSLPLVLNTDYELDVTASATNVGNYSTNIKGKGNYTSTTTANYAWKIVKSINSSDIKVTVETATYTGSDITPVVTITDPNNSERDGGILIKDEDYTITYKGSTLQDAKTYVDEIIITGAGVYSGTRYASFKIDPKGVTGLTATATVPYVDGGYSDADAVKAAWAVAVKDGTTPIRSDLYDVTLAAGEYTNAGIYPDVVTITFKEGKNYEGTIITDLNMALGGIDISSALVTSTAVYNGTTQAPSASSILVKVGDNEDNVLIYNTDFTLEYNGKADDYVHAQTYSDAIIIRGKGKYYGTTIADYVILPCPISLTTITVDAPYYNASPFNLQLEHKNLITIKIGEQEIDNSNYTVTPESVTEAGTYTLTITGLANRDLIGSTTATLKVRKSMIDHDYSDDFTFTEIPTQIYDGENAVQPEISVYDNGRLLIEGEEYTITYGENTIAEGATAIGTIIITGKGAYDPYDSPTTVTKYFAIVNEYFEEGNITYHAKSSTTVAVGNNGAAATTLTGAVAIPATVTLEVTLGETITPISFQVTGIEAGAFKYCTDITGIDMPHSTVYLEEIENGAFEGCTNLRYIDLCNATNFTPSSLQRNIEASPFFGVPKQALVYLNGTTFKGENYVYRAGTGAGAQYFCELFKIYDDMGGDQKHFAESNDYKWAYENPHQFTAYTITNTRMLTAEKHYTTCLPYPIAIPTGMKAYTLSASSDKLLGFEEVTTGTLAAFTPYVLIPTTSGQLLSATNTEVPATTAIEDFKKAGETSPTSVGGHKLVGTLRYMATGADGCYIMQSGNTWKAFTGTGSYPNGACILPMRAYIITSSYPAEARPFLSATFDSGTNIYNIDDLKFDNEDAIYDLSGRKVQTPQKGLYIVGGKKMMRK